MNALEKKLVPIAKILDRAWRDPDEALHWYTYGFEAEDVQRFVDLGVLDPHTAKALDQLGLRPGMIELARTPLVTKAEKTMTCECGGSISPDKDGKLSCERCGELLKAPA